MNKLGISVILSPGGLKRTVYSKSEIEKITSGKLNFFVERDLANDEKEEAKIQKLVNYDNFYTAPTPTDKGNEFEEHIPIDKKRYFIIISFAVLIIAGAIFYIVWQLF